MSTLEKVMQLKQQGVPDWDIVQSLRQQGISPKEINEALSQSNIKSAIATENPEEVSMQPSIMQQEYSQENYPQNYAQQMPAQYPSVQYQEPGAYSQEYYQEYQPQQQMDIETMNDIAEQIAEEKTEKLRQQISSIGKSKEEMLIEIKRIEDRIKKIEDVMDNLQMAILKKVGDYGNNIESISKEMRATQESFSKLANPLTENIRELQKITGNSQSSSPQSSQEASARKRRKSEPGFEDYLR